jgi:hypothetical protein
MVAGCSDAGTPLEYCLDASELDQQDRANNSLKTRYPSEKEKQKVPGFAVKSSTQLMCLLGYAGATEGGVLTELRSDVRDGRPGIQKARALLSAVSMILSPKFLQSLCDTKVESGIRVRVVAERMMYACG